LLDERPDLRAHELRLIAANADIGVAIADLYPGFSISGGYGFQSGVLDDLLRSDQIAWSIVSSVTARLFEGGRLRSNIKLQKSEARELAATYAKTVLEALREVEISLVQERETRNEFRAVQDRAYAAWTASRFAKKRYETGLLSLKEYLDVERNALDADIVLALAEQAMWQSRIAIHLALGGDWHKHETLEN
jgi:multidrug efflux system outer membrane protein